MSRRVPILLLAVPLLAAAASADVTFTSTTTGGAFGRSMTATSTTWIRGHKMRVDNKGGRFESSMIVDLDAQTMVVLDHKKQRAEIWNLQQISQQTEEIAASARTSLTATGSRKSVGGRPCEEYTASVALTPAPEAGIPMQMELGGPVCLSASAPGADDVRAFYRAASEKGFFFVAPGAGRGGQPGQENGMAVLLRKMADKGIPLSSDFSMRLHAEGPAAGMLERMGGMSIHTEVTDLGTGPVPEDRFEIPAGYKLKRR